MVRLVKGAYWDTEIKRAQVEGLDGFPVYTRKPATDVAFLCCAQKAAWLFRPDLCAIRHPQRPFGGGDPRHGDGFRRLRVSAPARHGRGAARDPAQAQRHPLPHLRAGRRASRSSGLSRAAAAGKRRQQQFRQPDRGRGRAGGGGRRRSRSRSWKRRCSSPAPGVTDPPDLYAPRRNSKGFDLHDRADMAAIEAARAPFADHQWQAVPVLAGPVAGDAPQEVRNPAKAGRPRRPCARGDGGGRGNRPLGGARVAGPRCRAPGSAAEGRRPLRGNFGEIFAVLSREAGKTLLDGVAELREAVDFLRYYADQATDEAPRGPFTCISPGTSRWPSSPARSRRRLRRATRCWPNRPRRPA